MCDKVTRAGVIVHTLQRRRRRLDDLHVDHSAGNLFVTSQCRPVAQVRLTVADGLKVALRHGVAPVGDVPRDVLRKEVAIGQQDINGRSGGCRAFQHYIARVHVCSSHGPTKSLITPADDIENTGQGNIGGGEA